MAKQNIFLVHLKAKENVSSCQRIKEEGIGNDLKYDLLMSSEQV